MADGPGRDDYTVVAGLVGIGPAALLCSSLASRLCRARGPGPPAVPASVPEPLDALDGQAGAVSVPPGAAEASGTTGAGAGSGVGKRERVQYLDYWRILCVVCVVVCHADESYGNWNMYGVTQWVLQIIMLISGTCYAFRRTSCLHAAAYTSRLAFLCSVGCAASFCAAVIGDKDWWGDPIVKVGYQNTFLLLMALASVFSTPLKAILDRDPGERSLRTSYRSLLAYLTVTAVCSCGWALSISQEVLRPVAASNCMLFLASLWTITAEGPRHNLLGWGMLAWMYAVQVGIDGGKLGYWFHLGDIYCWAVAVQRQPLLGQTRLGFFIIRNWPWAFIAAALLGSFPGDEVRGNRSPFPDAFSRARYNILEFAFIVAFIAVPTVGREHSVPISPELAPHLAALTYWGLFIFILHMAVYYVVQPMPWGLALNLLSGVVFVVTWHLWNGWRPTARRLFGHNSYHSSPNDKRDSPPVGVDTARNVGVPETKVGRAEIDL